MLEENISSNWNRIEESKSRKKDLSSRDERIKRLIGRGALHIKLKPKFSPSNIITNADTDQVEVGIFRVLVPITQISLVQNPKHFLSTHIHYTK